MEINQDRTYKDYYIPTISEINDEYDRKYFATTGASAPLMAVCKYKGDKEGYPHELHIGVDWDMIECREVLDANKTDEILYRDICRELDNFFSMKIDETDAIEIAHDPNFDSLVRGDEIVCSKSQVMAWNMKKRYDNNEVRKYRGFYIPKAEDVIKYSYPDTSNVSILCFGENQSKDVIITPGQVNALWIVGDFSPAFEEGLSDSQKEDMVYNIFTKYIDEMLDE